MLATVSREELKAKMDRGETFTLVETLAEVAYQHEHLPGAINLPLRRLETEARDVLDPSRPVIVYCFDSA